MQAGRLFFPLLCVMNALAAPLARGAIEPATDWYMRFWQTADGLPSANVTGVAQTKDGYLCFRPRRD